MKKTIYILRGAPGAGKTTFVNTKLKPYYAKVGATIEHYENDMFFIDPETGEYNWSADRLGEAIKFCQDHVRTAMEVDTDVVIVSNTAIKPFEYADYLAMAKQFGYEVIILKLNGKYQNVHGCPLETVERMRANFDKNTEGQDAYEYFETLPKIR